MNRIYVMLKGDFKNISRDLMLVFILVSPLIIALIFNFLIPYTENLLEAELEIQLGKHYLFISSFLIMLVPMMYGMIISFLIIEENDENILAYLFVTPLSKIEYLLYRTLIAIVMSTIFNIFILYYLNIVEVKLIQSLPVIMLAALNSILTVLIIVTFAKNKVEAFAYAKISGILFLAPLIGYIFESPWRYLAAIFPPFWISEAFISIYRVNLNYLSALTCGLIIYSLWIYFLGKYLIKNI